MLKVKSRKESISASWRKTSLGRLRLELGGLSFALQKGFSAKDYACHLWSKGAKTWMGSSSPNAKEYLLKEAEAFRCFYPEVVFKITEAKEDKAELLFIKGCLGGWGEDLWRLAHSLSLSRKDVCAYCHESFSIWTKQLNLKVHIGPRGDKICRLQVIKEVKRRGKSSKTREKI